MNITLPAQFSTSPFYSCTVQSPAYEMVQLTFRVDLPISVDNKTTPTDMCTGQPDQDIFP